MPGLGVRVRPARSGDETEVAILDARLTGRRKPATWREIFAAFSDPGAGPGRVALVAEGPAGLAGYLFGAVRAVEFGSEPCGWIFAVAVDPAEERAGVGTALLEEACLRFREAGVARVRTMVRRNDVPVLSFFRARGFVGGPFVQLERPLEVAP
jgi:ribosomal protein S18 acetylase RimI-like enzyme